MYQMSFLSVEVPRNFPVEGYRGGGGGATSTCRYQIVSLICPQGRA